ncbi:T-cell surface glycoprotein YE1/48-like [Erpetoichthys calabaricus]|uniref:T-cell surface glycoprotein YE1/48-like n=1 Tax=Erpetoichthys calabaricus TaxID=27687 RepID=UPI002234747A|nr:T-cell surface glycoprotein YE1/48-like [Erpetoichthys calabaricus]
MYVCSEAEVMTEEPTYGNVQFWELEGHSSLEQQGEKNLRQKPELIGYVDSGAYAFEEDHTYGNVQYWDQEVHSSLEQQDKKKKKRKKKKRETSELKGSVDSEAKTNKDGHTHEVLQIKDLEVHSSPGQQDKNMTATVPDTEAIGHKTCSLCCRIITLIILITLGLAITVVCLLVMDKKSDGMEYSTNSWNTTAPGNTAFSNSVSELTEPENRGQVTSYNQKESVNKITFSALGVNSYYFSSDKKAWKSARLFCEENRASLAVFKDKEDLDKVTQNFSQAMGGGSYWIGLNKDDTGPHWHWVGGIPLDSHSFNLDISEPSRSCAMMTIVGLKASQCATINKWICQKSTAVK